MPCNVPTPIEKTKRKTETTLPKWVGLKTKAWSSVLRVRSFGLQLLQFNGEAFKPPPNCGQSPPPAFVNLLPQTLTPRKQQPGAAAVLVPQQQQQASPRTRGNGNCRRNSQTQKQRAGSWNLECAYPKHVLQKPKKVFITDRIQNHTCCN